MTQTLGSLKRKIELAAELQQVVETMKTMAAVNIGTYEKVDRTLAEYYRTIETALIALLHNYHPVAVPSRHGKKGGVGVAIFGSDQGMVGQFNDNLAGMALERLLPMAGEATVWCVGERVGLKLRDKLPLRRLYRVPGSPKGITALVGELLLDIAGQQDEGKIGKLLVLFNKPLAGASYETIVETILPIDPQWLFRLAGQPWPTRMVPQVISASGSTGFFIKEYLLIKICWACTQSIVSENIARLSSMQRAAGNIEEILAGLTLDYNQERQNAITEELFDVVSGYDVLARQETVK